MDIKELLNGRDTETLARWSCMLNQWEWPGDLPGKPAGFDYLPAFYPVGHLYYGTEPTKRDFIEPLRTAIDERIGVKEVARYHHLHNLCVTNEQFEHWWSLDAAGDMEGAFLYYEELGGVNW